MYTHQFAGSLGYPSTQQPMQQMQQTQVRGDRHVTPPPPENLWDVQKKLELARMHFNALQQEAMATGVQQQLQAYPQQHPQVAPPVHPSQVSPTFASPGNGTRQLPVTASDPVENLKMKVEELEEKVKKLEGPPAKTWPITHDNRYRTLTKYAMDPVGMPQTTGGELVNKITLPDSVYTSVWLIPLIDSRLWYGEPAKKFTDVPTYLQEKYATKELNDAVLAAEFQGEKVRQMQEEMEMDPLSHTKEEFDKQEALYEELDKVAEQEKSKVAKPDNTGTLFADWDRPNMYGLTPAQALFSLYIPTFLSWCFVLILQFSYIYYIQEVVSKLSHDGVEKYGALNCYGSSVLTDSGGEWDANNPIVLRIVCLLTFMTEIARELSECVQYIDWIAEVPVFQPPVKRTDCKKWTEVEFASAKPKGTEITNAELSSVLEDLLRTQDDRHLRWSEIPEGHGNVETRNKVEIKDTSKDKALTRALMEERVKFTIEEFDYLFDFEYLPDEKGKKTRPGRPKFTYDSYMKVADTFFRPYQLLRVDFTTAKLQTRLTTPEAKAILNKNPKDVGCIKVGKTYFKPIDFESGHGMTWKYQSWETGNYKISNGQVKNLTVTKPITGISTLYRSFIYFCILAKVVIAVALGIYGGGWILFGAEDAGTTILNTLASCFIFEVDDIVFMGMTSKLGKAICDGDLHTITFCSREPAQMYTNWKNMGSWFVAAFLLIASTIALNYGWLCENGPQ